MAPSSSTQDRPAPTAGGAEHRTLAVAALLCGAAGLGGWVAGSLLGDPPAARVLYAAAYGAGGIHPARAAFRALRSGRLDVDLLMLVAAAGAAGIGHWAEGAVLLLLFSVGNALEAYAFARTRRSIQALMALRPPTASVVRDGRERRLAVDRVPVGAVVRVRPGERIPVDGVVLAGESAVEEATLTGEAEPVRKRPGAPVFAGTLNGRGTLDVRVGRSADDTTLARIIRMVEEAKEARAPVQSWIERVESRYAGGVLAASAAAFLLPVLAFGWSPEVALYRAMTLLVAASPCALVISIPATVVSAVARGARDGILFKGGIHLDALADVRAVAFDKTGTLTRGRPELRAVRLVHRPDFCRRSPETPTTGEPPRSPEDELLRLVAGVESRSEHPLGVALVRAARERGLPLPDPTRFRSLPGRGVEGEVRGRRLLVGRREWIEERTRRPLPPSLLLWASRNGRAGSTRIFVAEEGRAVGALLVADRPRPGARRAVEALRREGVPVVAMLTGDDRRAAEAIAREVGIDEVYGGLLPEDKTEIVRRLRERHGPVALVGDGVNDAPALAAADVGIAVGAAGSDVALETADVVLMGEELTRIAHARALSRRARRVVIQNLVFASAVIVILAALAVGGAVGLPLAVLGHEGSTVLVVFNGLRLLRPSTG